MEQLLSQGGCRNGATMTKGIAALQCSHENQTVFGLNFKKKKIFRSKEKGV